MRALLIVLLLTGCGSVPVARNFPEVPAEIIRECPTLQQTQNDAKLSDVLTTVTKNYSQYHECRARQAAWIEWYNTQKKIFDEVK
jgi:hypothetical protein